MANPTPRVTPVQLFLPLDAPEQLLEPVEIYRLDDVALLSRLKEDRRIERKSAGISQRALGDYICMWANTTPFGGLVVVGMEDDGAISGCRSTAMSHLNDLERAGDIHCPDARYESKRLHALNVNGEDDFLLVVIVHYRRDKVARTSRGDAFARRGESKRQLSEDEIRELEIDKGQLDLEQELTTVQYPGGFDREMITAFANAFRVSRGLGPERGVEEILHLRHLGVMEKGVFHPNNACALLFAKDPQQVFPGCRLRFMRFDGEVEGTGTQFNAVKDVWVEGPVPTVITETEKLLQNQLRDFSRLGPDGKFYTAPEYPKEAWYEAIVNACVHRSYGLRNMHVQVKMFDDRLEIISPGGFPPLVTPQNIYETQHSRNPYLMDAMLYLDFVKMANEGTRRMRDTMSSAGLPVPEFRETQATFTTVRVILRNNIKQRKVWLDADASAVVGAAVFAGLTQDQKRLVNWVAEHGKINVSQAQRLITSRTWHTTKKVLVTLCDLGVFEYNHRADIERDPDAHFILRIRKP